MPTSCSSASSRSTPSSRPLAAAAPSRRHRRTGLQNARGQRQRLRAALVQPVFATVVYVGAINVAPGVVRHTGRGDLVLGLLARDLARDRVARRTRADACGDLRARWRALHRLQTIEADLWRKLAINCVYNAISAVGYSDYGRMLAHGPTSDLIPLIVAECVEVARADGVMLEQDALLQSVRAVGAALPDADLLDGPGRAPRPADRNRRAERLRGRTRSVARRPRAHQPYAARAGEAARGSARLTRAPNPSVILLPRFLVS